jgi:hypothetical protein
MLRPPSGVNGFVTTPDRPISEKNNGLIWFDLP